MTAEAEVYREAADLIRKHGWVRERLGDETVFDVLTLLEQAATKAEKEALGQCRVCGILTRPATDMCVEHAANEETTDWRELADDLGKALRWTLGTGGGRKETSTETEEVLRRWQDATEDEKEAQS